LPPDPHRATQAGPFRRGLLGEEGVCFESPRAGKIAERGVLVWNGRGRVRFSLHGCHDVDDVEAALEAVKALRNLV
jgi:selenocysteine lyase/cysteine desulfurase